MSNSIITHDKELNYIDNNQHDISVNVIDKSNTIIDRMSSSDLSDKAKLLLLEESKHAKAFNFESFDTEYEHKTNHHHHQPPQQILQLSHHKEQQQHIDPIADINNFNIRFNDHRRLNNLPTEKKRIKRMPKPNAADPILYIPPKHEYTNSYQKGPLKCKGQQLTSEVVYWKIVPGDHDYESSITPHHDNHHTKYITVAYDFAGWNNIRMGLECMIVFAHATGRTLVIPPQDHLYLLEKNHKDDHDKNPHDEMGFEDFFDIDLLKSHKGLNIITMKEFLEREGIVGNLNGIYPPDNNTDIVGHRLWKYLEKVADQVPEWFNKVVVLPGKSMDFNMSISLQNKKTKDRLDQFLLGRPMMLYDDKLQNAKLIHAKAGPQHRILEHFYAFNFFADSSMQTYYKRFIRDYVRYKDSIQCIGHDFIKLLRQESMHLNPLHNGDYYALHVRRGDFQYPSVKITAEKIVENLHYHNGTPIIPSGALVYISTDDPKGICQGCPIIIGKKYFACKDLPHPRPRGCPNATGWGPFEELAGWNIR